MFIDEKSLTFYRSFLPSITLNMVVAGPSSEISVIVTTQNGVIFQKTLNFNYVQLLFYTKKCYYGRNSIELVDSVLIV